VRKKNQKSATKKTTLEKRRWKSDDEKSWRETFKQARAAPRKTGRPDERQCRARSP